MFYNRRTERLIHYFSLFTFHFLVFHFSLLVFHLAYAPQEKKHSEPRSSRPSFHERLSGFDIRINPFGELESTLNVDQLNTFLNDEVEDKKIGRKKSEEKNK